MGKLSKKIQKRIQLGPDYSNKYLTGEEYDRLYNDVGQYVINSVGSDFLLVMVDILENHWGALAKRETRFETFGRLFKEKIGAQSKSHDKTYVPFLVAAGLTEVEYGG